MNWIQDGGLLRSENAGLARSPTLVVMSVRPVIHPWLAAEIIKQSIIQ